MTLKSYACGNWYEARTDLVAVPSAVDGRTVASVSSSGLDVAAMLRHARTVGGKNLRALTFAQRVAMLHDIATYLSERKDALYEISFDTGATRGDHALDIDRGIATLFWYASRGRRELPSGHVVIDGSPEPLADGGTFVGRHILSPRLGVAVFINAYSFPCRGFLEKFAPAFLAGVPVVVKPATPTAYVAARVIEYVLESRIVPEGTLQSIIGAPGDLFEHLTGQDTVAFTGSLETSLKLRAHPALMRRGVRIIAERESPCAAVLGPDAD
ncbi:MAG: aldehyde dehydrogenase family protein, partial [Candidatus Eremiobacteraeota bacterium]|nr:aldehyde dehydrogenase family protein [Candidatus Eremiobacteraeota bacterium]